MPRDKALSHERIIEAAKEEFQEYGYEKASMRRIGDRCGLTAAALYRHFDSKEAMFEALVKPAIDDLEEWVRARALRSDEKGTSSQDDFSSIWKCTEIDMMRELVYPRIAEFSLLLNKAGGSKYENFVHELVSDHQKMIDESFARAREMGRPARDVSEKELHMLMTAYCTALFEPVVHLYPLDEALKYLDTVECFFVKGWKDLMGY